MKKNEKNNRIQIISRGRNLSRDNFKLGFNYLSVATMHIKFRDHEL